MLVLNNDKVCFEYNYCQQCGICQAVCPVNAISLILKNNGLSDVVVNHDICIKCKKCVRCCPSNVEFCVDSYKDKFSDRKYYLGHNKNSQIRRESSSGGVARTLIIESLNNNIVDGVYSLKKSSTYPFAEGEFYSSTNMPTFDKIPNSVYHSVMMCKNIGRVQKCNRLMIVGTTCQLQAMQYAVKGKYDELIKVCIFCKQQKTLDSTRFLAKVMKTSISQKNNFVARYRGDGWPGFVMLNGTKLSWNRAAQVPFGRRLWTVPGCNICGDPFGLNVAADITLMDPWIIRSPNDLGETLVIVHTNKGEDLVKRMESLNLQEKTFLDVESALGLVDIRRKQQLIPYFLDKKCRKQVEWAGRLEVFQRRVLQCVVEKLPRLPFIFYRIICKMPDLRNIILK